MNPAFPEWAVTLIWAYGIFLFTVFIVNPIRAFFFDDYDRQDYRVYFRFASKIAFFPFWGAARLIENAFIVSLLFTLKIAFFSFRGAAWLIQKAFIAPRNIVKKIC